jgi:tetratricopeptide (TPR) repeat protein
MAPEQAAGQTAQVGPAADVYALGAILYECLTGRPPFRAATVLDTLGQVRSQDPVPPRQLQPLTPRDLDTVCLKCLEKTPGRRYASAAQLAADLDAFLSDRPIQARPPGVLERAVKFTRRNKVLVGSVVVVMLVLVFGLLRTSLAQARAERAAEEARRNLLDFYAEAAQRAAQRGQHREALEFYDRALATSHPDPIGMHLQRARALLALNRAAQAQEEVKGIAASAVGGPHEGTLLLLQAELAMGDDNERAVQLLRQALAKGLSGADETYARAMLADNSVAAVKLLERALEQDRFHHWSHGMLGIALIFQGRLEEADNSLRVAGHLFPDDSGIKIAHALLSARRGHLESANALLATAGTQLPSDQVEALRSGIEAIYLLRDWSTLPPERWDAVRKQALLKLTPLVSRLRPGLEQGQVEGPGAAGVLLRVPPFLTKSMTGLAQALPHLLLGQVNDEVLARLNDSLQANPEGLMYYVVGIMLFSRQRWVEAEQAFHMAAHTPATFPCRRPALVGAIASAAALAWPEKGSNNLAMQRKALENLRLLLQMGPLRPEEAGKFAQVAINAREYDLARLILADWERQTADIEAVKLRVELEIQAGCHFAALQYVERWGQQTPADRRIAAYRSQVVERIRQASKSL